MNERKPWLMPALASLLIGILVACQAQQIKVTRVVPEKETVLQTVIETIVEQETVVVTATAAPEPEGDRTLVICIADEPESLYPYVVNEPNILTAIYDGPVETRGYGYQPVIVEKMPSLSDGDAVIRAVKVAAGDRIVSEGGEPVTLEEGVVVRPAGCASSDCAVVFDGTSLEMEQMEVTFKLKPGVTWSDGVPLTAYDSVLGFELFADPDTPVSKYMTRGTESYVATDDHTTVWTGLPGFRNSDYQNALFAFFPEHIWGDMTALELVEAEESNRKPLGWGPYVIDEWVPGDHISLHKNERYWRADEGLPHFDRLIYRFTGGNPGTALAELLSGECDILDRSHGLQEQSELLLELQAKGQINASFLLGGVWEHADFGLRPVEGYERPDVFGDVRTRRAIAHCMDRQTLVDAVSSGQSVVLDSFVTPYHPLHNSDVPQYPFDVARGSALLDDVGWIDDDGDPTAPRVAQGVAGMPDGTPLEFNYLTTTTNERQLAARVFQTSMAQCGIKLNLEYWNPPQFFADGPEGPIWGRRFDMAQYAWQDVAIPSCHLYTTQQIPGDPEALDENGDLLYPLGWSGANNTGFSSPAYDAACNAAMSAMPGTPEYEQYNREALRIWAEELPSVPLYPWVQATATRPDLKGFDVDPTDFTEIWNIEEFEIAD